MLEGLHDNDFRMGDPRNITGQVTVDGTTIQAKNVATAVMALANLPALFTSADISDHLGNEHNASVRSKAASRLMQRWRKLGLAKPARLRRWTVSMKAWDDMQSAAMKTLALCKKREEAGE